jgi:hypothetical protein
VNLLEQAAQMEALSAEVGDAGEMDLQEMFETQLALNQFSQLGEMTSSVFQALNQAKMNAARGIK